MSSAILPGPAKVGDPPRPHRFRLLLSVVAALLLAFGGLFAMQPAHASTQGPGYDIGQGWIGAYVTDDGLQVYCIDLGLSLPASPTPDPQTVTSLDSLSPQELAELNYVLGKWGQSLDANVTSAVAMFVWSVTDKDVYNSHDMPGDAYYLGRAPESERAAILALLDRMRSEAATGAVTDPSLSLSIEMADRYAGTLTVAANPAQLQGPVTLTGATFSDGSTSTELGTGQFAITGTPEDGAPGYQIGASMTAAADGFGAKVDLYVAGAGEQRTIASVAGAPGSVSASTQTPRIGLDFQPVIGTQVAARHVAEGDAFVDELRVQVVKGSWTLLDGERMPVTATGTLYGPFDEQPAETDAPPPGAPVAGVEQIKLTGPGSYTSAGSITAASSGFYTWVWAIDKDAQGEHGQYLAGSFTDRFGRVAETAAVAFQPKAVSTVMQDTAAPGDDLTDQLEISTMNGPWLKVDGQPIPVVFEGTLYQVPGTNAPVQAGTIDPEAVPIRTVTVTATGPGTYTSPAITAPDPGFVTWVWQVRISAQPEWVRPYLAADWTDDYGVPAETTQVRKPPSELAQTGGGDWAWTFGLGAGLLLLAGAGALVVGRRLALIRERSGQDQGNDVEYGGIEDIEGIDPTDSAGKRRAWPLSFRGGGPRSRWTAARFQPGHPDRLRRSGFETDVTSSERRMAPRGAGDTPTGRRVVVRPFWQDPVDRLRGPPDVVVALAAGASHPIRR